MNFWKRRGDEAATVQAVQLRDRERHPYAGLRSFTPQRGGELRLYQAVREAVPVVDAAVCKLIRLSGGALVFCEDPETEKRLRDFLERVPAGRGQYGINAFLEQYLESLLICGGAVGEMVPAAGNRDLAALLCGRMDRIELREGESPLDFQIYGPDERGRMAALPYQELLLFTPLHPEAEHPYGVSLLRGLPFMADILMKIYNTVGINWERCGNMRFAVTCRDSDGSAAERGQILAQEWSRAMQDTRSGSVRDFVAVGDVDIKVIGGDAPILDSQVPVRQVLEQIVAKTSIPPFMLGLNWNSTERMSAQQADMLTTEITAIRRTLTPVVEQICRMWLRMQGETAAFRVDWEDINLQDEVEEAKAELYTMNTMLVSNDMMLAMLKLSEFQNPNTGLNFQATGKLTTPLGAKLLRSSAVPAGTIIGLDKNYALEQICGSEVVVEYDKLIDRQLERAAITSVSGFAKLFTDAAKVLKV